MTQAASSQSESRLPIREFSSGRVRATIWENLIDRDGEKVLLPNVKITRSYKDDKNNWQETTSFDAQSLADMIDVAKAARKFIRLRGRDPRAQNASQEPVVTEEIPV